MDLHGQRYRDLMENVWVGLQLALRLHPPPLSQSRLLVQRQQTNNRQHARPAGARSPRRPLLSEVFLIVQLLTPQSSLYCNVQTLTTQLSLYSSVCSLTSQYSL